MHSLHMLSGKQGEGRTSLPDWLGWAGFLLISNHWSCFLSVLAIAGTPLLGE
jgi:hypothetical protein